MLIKFMLLQKSSSVPTIAGSKPQGALRPNQLIPTYIWLPYSGSSCMHVLVWQPNVANVSWSVQVMYLA